VRHNQDTLAQEMVASRFDHHGAARARIDRQLRDIQGVYGERVAVRLVSFVRTGSVIGELAQICATLVSAWRQARAAFSSGTGRQGRDAGRNIVDDPMPPTGRVVAIIGIISVTTKLFVPAGEPDQVKAGEVLPPVQS